VRPLHGTIIDDQCGLEATLVVGNYSRHACQIAMTAN
jgi:hypothetical protein